MAINNVLVRRARESGGAGVGGVIGGILGAIAAPITGGASLAAIPAAAAAGAGTGHAIGSTVGGLVAPGKQAEAAPVIPTSDSFSRKLASSLPPPNEPPQSKILEDSLRALHESNDRNMQEQYGKPLFKAYSIAMDRERIV